MYIGQFLSDVIHTCLFLGEVYMQKVKVARYVTGKRYSCNFCLPVTIIIAASNQQKNVGTSRHCRLSI